MYKLEYHLDVGDKCFIVYISNYKLKDAPKVCKATVEEVRWGRYRANLNNSNSAIKSSFTYRCAFAEFDGGAIRALDFNPKDVYLTRADAVKAARKIVTEYFDRSMEAIQ